MVEVRAEGIPPFFAFFWGREGGWPGMDWPSGLGGVGGRGRASTHEAFSWVGRYKSWVLNLTKKLSFFGAEKGGPWSEATEARDGLAFGLGRSRG